MKIEINNSKVLDIKEECLIIKNNKLYNNVTKQYEGVDGDIVTFYVATSNGGQCWTRGTVDGYTCGRMVKLRGVEKPYEIAEGCIKVIDKVSSITDAEYEDKKEKEEDWNAILSA